MPLISSELILTLFQSDCLRHQIHLHPHATHGYYIVDDKELQGLNEPHLFKFCDGDNPYTALEQARLDLISSASPAFAPASSIASTATKVEEVPSSDSQSRQGPRSHAGSSSRRTMLVR